jgi:hypothetical protein
MGMRGRFAGDSGFSFRNAAFAADASMPAYARHGEIRMTEDGFKGILRDAGFTTRETIGECFVSGVATDRGFFAADDGFAILAFRGTEADDWHDLVADLEGPLVAQKALGGPGAGRVHEGFQAYLEPIWDRVAALVAAYRAGDLVTHVAPTELIPDYAHPNSALPWIDSTGAISPLFLADHSPVRYCHWIGKRSIGQVFTTPLPTSPPTPV